MDKQSFIGCIVVIFQVFSNVTMAYKNEMALSSPFEDISTLVMLLEGQLMVTIEFLVLSLTFLILMESI